MANDLSATTWFLDTPGATVLWQGQVYIKSIQWWDGSGSVGDLLEITDRNGKSIVKTQAQAGGDVQSIGVDHWVEGFVLKTLTSGNVRVHIK